MIGWLTKLKEIPAGCVSDKGVVSIIYKEILEVTLERQTYPLKELKGGMSKQLSKEDIQVAHKYKKQCLVWSPSGNTEQTTV